MERTVPNSAGQKPNIGLYALNCKLEVCLPNHQKGRRFLPTAFVLFPFMGLGVPNPIGRSKANSRIGIEFKFEIISPKKCKQLGGNYSKSKRHEIYNIGIPGNCCEIIFLKKDSASARASFR